MSLPPRYRCPYCHKSLTSDSAIKRHISATPICKQAWEDELTKDRSDTQPAASSRKDTSIDLYDTIDLVEPEEGPSLSKRARVEEVEDEEDLRQRGTGRRFVKSYSPAAGKPIKEGKTKFMELFEEQERTGNNKWAPFASQEEWGLVRWLSSRVGHKAIDEFLKLPIIRNRNDLSFHNSYSYLKKVDKLPTGPDWHCEIVQVEGDRLGEDGKPMVENLELWFRDPVDCVKELLANPAFRGFTSYAPEQVFSDVEGKDCVFDEMWTADWWWKIQDKLPAGVSIAPIILSSDKTQLSVFQGDKSAWPVYLTIGNISKEVRRQPSAHATILLGYLPVAKLECYKESSRSLAGYCLFHFCMSKILASLVKAGSQGVEITCNDGFVRLFYLILAAYIADYPEQCLVGCCMENRCPRCTVSPENRGKYVQSLHRDYETTIKILEEHHKGGDPIKFDQYGIRAVYQPFWKNLPHCDIFNCFTPDLLHQLHKGVFKDHLVKWCTSIIGEAELDARFKAMTSYHDLRHFKKGISFVTQWTGTEHKEMEKVFLGALAGAVSAEVLTVAKALLDFIYYSQFQLHTSSTLASLEQCLRTFHQHKDIFITLGIREHFNIPKLHSIMHYVEAIRSLGSCDGYNTESPERLHIDYAKAAYRASNKRDYVEQMTIWLQRQEAMWLKDAYLMWLGDELPRLVADDAIGKGDISEGDSEEEATITLSQAPAAIRSQNWWHVAKAPAFRNLSMEQLATQFGAIDFVQALSAYIKKARPTCPISPNQYDRIDAYRKLTIDLPPNNHLSSQQRMDRIRTTPAVAARGRKPATAGQFDVALVIEDKDEYRSGTGLMGQFQSAKFCVWLKTHRVFWSGLRPAQIRVIFDLPQQFGNINHPLVYIEWFTPLGRPDPQTGMHIVKRSTRYHRRNAEVVPVQHIIRGCHLMAKHANRINQQLTTRNVLDEATHFYLNPYINVDTFALLK